MFNPSIPRENIDAQVASADGRATLYANGQTHMFERKVRTITVDELFLILEMAHFQSGDKLQKKIYRNTFKILEKNAAESTLTKTVLNEIRKETCVFQ